MEKLNQWLTLLANVGVLVGIVFLAIEIRQNTNNLEMNRQIALTEAYANRTRTISSAELGDRSNVQTESQYIMWKQGLLEEGFVDTLRDITMRYAEGWRDLDILWAASGGYREEVERALQENDRKNREGTGGP